MAGHGHTMTVLGPVPPGELGLTLVHEHLFLDLSGASLEPLDGHEELRSARVSRLPPEVVRANSCAILDNLRFDDHERVRAEVAAFLRAGGRTIVDTTPHAIGRQPAALRRLAEEAGANIVMGCGHYVERAHGAAVATISTDAIAENIVEELLRGVSGVQPGIIGEIGVSGIDLSGRRLPDGITANERKVLRASLHASLQTGCPVTVHLPTEAATVHAVLDAVRESGVDPASVSLSHMDSVPDLSLHREAVESGVWIQYDCFGMNLSNSWWTDVGDETRIAWLLDLAATGHIERTMISHDVWAKCLWSAYGGPGYTHIPTVILPELRRRGLDPAALAWLVEGAPASFLTWRAVPSNGDSSRSA